MSFADESKLLMIEAIQKNFMAFSYLSKGNIITEEPIHNGSGMILKFKIVTGNYSVGREMHFDRHMNGTPYCKAQFDYGLDTNGIPVLVREKVLSQFDELMKVIMQEWMNHYTFHV